MPWRPRPAACASTPGPSAGPSNAWGGRAKKKSLRASERDHAGAAAARQDWRAELEAVDPARLVFIDESAAPTNLVRVYARSLRGTRAHGTAPCGYWTRLTVIGALGVEGMVGAMALEAATSGAVFAAFLDRVLLPELRRIKPDAMIVMDNLAARKTRAVREAVRDLLERSGFAHRYYLPPYSPDRNPIEPAWAKVKAQLRKAGARTAEALHQALGLALDAISARDASGFFHHAGYARPN
jgi:transposase